MKGFLLAAAAALSLALPAAGAADPTEAADSVLESAGATVKLACPVEPERQLDTIGWTKDGRPLSAGTVLTLDGLGSEDVGLYACEDDSTGEALFTTYVFVEGSGDLLVPPGGSIVRVQPRGQAIIPCRPTTPDVSVTLVREATQQEVDLEEAGMEFDPRRGFVIREGNLKHHNGRMRCQASGPEGDTDSETFFLSFGSWSNVSGGAGTGGGSGRRLPKPKVDRFEKKWSVGERQVLSCSLTVPASEAAGVSLRWETPDLTGETEGDEYRLEEGRITVKRFDSKKKGAKKWAAKLGIGKVTISSVATVDPVTLSDDGYYACRASSGARESSAGRRVEVDSPASPMEWELSSFNPNVTTAEVGSDVKWVVGLHTHGFHPRLEWFRPDGGLIPSDLEEKYSLRPEVADESEPEKLQVVCIVKAIDAGDMGRYELRVSDAADPAHKPLGRLYMSLYLVTKPRLRLEAVGGDDSVLHQVDGENELKCSVVSFPIEDTNITISLRECKDSDCSAFVPRQKKLSFDRRSDGVSTAELAIYMSEVADRKRGGIVKCTACKRGGSADCSSAELPFLLTDLTDPIKVTKEKTGGGGGLTLLCAASRALFSSVSWWWRSPDDERGDFRPVGGDEEHLEVVASAPANWSALRSELRFDSQSPSPNGVYRCEGVRREEGEWALYPWMEGAEFQTWDQEKVSARIPSKPAIVHAYFENNSVVHLSQEEPLPLYCIVDGFPDPSVTWFRDGAEIGGAGDRGYQVSEDGTKLTIDSSLQAEADGEYSCRAENRLGVAEMFVQVEANHKSKDLAVALSVSIIVAVVVVVAVTIYYRAKVKRAKTRLPKKDVDMFKNGDPEALKSLTEGAGNDDEREKLIMSGDNAIMLPYDRRLEFPLEKLSMGSQIGAGQFGRVLKAQARGIVPREQITTVAVKTLKYPAELEHLKSLMSELKILSHIGRHPNLLNLLGACTTRLQDWELYVILEYCHLGNLQQLLVNSRRVFKPGVMTQSKSLGKPITPKLSPGPNPAEGAPGYYTDFNAMHLESLLPDHGEAIEDFLTMGDLFTWALHVAKGMEYLSARRFLHGDLACRNILIAEDGTAKISDFGLSKNIYRSDTYKKQSNTKLPVKWLAPESIRDQEFSTQSDVWSYGIVLWEMFSLGQTPYPGMEPGMRLYEFLAGGGRMKAPETCPGYAYDIMLACWGDDPASRLSFERICALLVREIRLSAYAPATPSPLNLAGDNLMENPSYLVLQEDEARAPQPRRHETDQDGYLICLKSPPAAPK